MMQFYISSRILILTLILARYGPTDLHTSLSVEDFSFLYKTNTN